MWCIYNSQYCRAICSFEKILLWSFKCVYQFYLWRVLKHTCPACWQSWQTPCCRCGNTPSGLSQLQYAAFWKWQDNSNQPAKLKLWMVYLILIYRQPSSIEDKHSKRWESNDHSKNESKDHSSNQTWNCIWLKIKMFNLLACTIK